MLEIIRNQERAKYLILILVPRVIFVIENIRVPKNTGHAEDNNNALILRWQQRLARAIDTLHFD